MGRCNLWTIILALVGLRAWKSRRCSEEERASRRRQAKEFRKRMRYAFSVWDEEDPVHGDSIE